MFTRIKTLQEVTEKLPIAQERITLLENLSTYISAHIRIKNIPKLNFICTHNSRRSQLAQIWAKVAAVHFDIEIESYSGGTEVTALNERVAASLERFGFELGRKGNSNPVYRVAFGGELILEKAWSKLFDDKENPKNGFAAVMTCSAADENCPFVPGCDSRIPLTYEDPKDFDDTPLESMMYDYRSFQIATEMFYVFGKVEAAPLSNI